MTVYSISKLQAEAEQWTRELKKKHRPESDEYKKARALYFSAKASVGGWIDQVETDVRALRDIRVSGEAQKAQAQATESAQKLVDHLNVVFAQGVFPGGGAILTAAGKAFSDTVTQIVADYIKVRETRKKEQIEGLIKQLERLRWREFDEV